MSDSHAEIPSTVSAPKHNTTLQIDNIETFYRIICQAANDKKHMFSDALCLVEKNYYGFILAQLKKTYTPEQWSDIKKRILLFQLNALQEKNFFKDKIDENSLALIKQDILDNGKQLKLLLSEDEYDDFIFILLTIKSDIRGLVVTEKNYPDRLEAGLPAKEQNKLNTDINYQFSFLSRETNNQGIKQLENKEWEQAIKSFEEAIAIETNLPVEIMQNQDIGLISIYKRNLSCVYNLWGIHLHEQNQYQEAIEKYTAANQILVNIDPAHKTKHDNESLTINFRNIAHAYNSIAIDFYNSGQFVFAIEKFQTALHEQGKVIPEYVTEIDEENTLIYQRNLAQTYNQAGNKNCQEKNFITAVQNYQASIDIVTKFESLTEQDQVSLKHFQNNLIAAKKKMNESAPTLFNKKRKLKMINKLPNDDHNRVHKKRKTG